MPRRYPRWQDALGTTIAGLWPVVLTLGVLRNPAKYNPEGVYSGLSSVQFHSLSSLPSTDPNVYGTAYALGIRSASMLVHGHLPWWNSYEGLGAPMIGELQSGGLFPFTPLLLLHDGSLIFHLALELVAGIATYWLLREFRCNPIVATIGGMLYATNGTMAWLANAAFNPVCFLPIMLLGLERARRAAANDKGGGWRWLAVGTAFALLAGFVETAALGLVFIVVIAVQRGFTLERTKVWVFVRKSAAGLVAGVAIASPALVAFGSYLQNGSVAEHAGNAASGHLGGQYVSMLVSPYLFGRIHSTLAFPIHNMWGAVGGYAGFALLALGVASLFGKRDRALRLTLAGWIVVSLGDTLGLPVIHSVVSSLPVLNHIVLYRNLPPTWELALVLLAGFALRDLATKTRAEALIALTAGVLSSAVLLLIGLSMVPKSVQAARALLPRAFHSSELLVVAVIAGLLLACLAPARIRPVLVGVVVVAEAAVLFAVPLLSWPSHVTMDTKAVTFISKNVGTARFFSIGVPSANFGSQVGVGQLNIVDLPVPKLMVPIIASIDPYENPTSFTGMHKPFPGAPSPAQLALHDVDLYAKYGVRFVIAPTRLQLFKRHHLAKLVYQDKKVEIWRLPHTTAPVRAPGCPVTIRTADSYVVTCHRPSVLLRNELWFPGWTATVNGVSVPVQNRGSLQAVPLPVGRSVVALTFLPPYVPLAGLAALLAVLALFVPWEYVARRRRRKEREDSGLETLAASLPSRPAPAMNGDAVAIDPPTGAVTVVPGVIEDPPTSAIPVVAGPMATEDPPTSAVPAIAGAVLVTEDPPTSAVAVVTPPPPPAPAPAADPPTLAVKIARPNDKDATT